MLIFFFIRGVERGLMGGGGGGKTGFIYFLYTVDQYDLGLKKNVFG